MLKSWKYLIGGLIGVVVVTSIVVPVTIQFTRNNITIRSDRGFEKYGFPGEGTKNDPYIITNYTIRSNANYAIFISGTTKYFIIQDCHLRAKTAAIYIRNILYGTGNISRNECYSGIYGMLLRNTPGILITDNDCSSNQRSISISSSTNVTLNRNILWGGTCMMVKTEYGISLDSCNYSILTNNTCSYDWDYAIILRNSFYASLTGNICKYYSGDGIRLVNSLYSSLKNNTCNYEISYGFNGIILEDSPYSSLSNNSCKHNMVGIHLVSCNYTSLTYNDCTKNRIDGIRLSTSFYSTLVNNTCNNNDFNGIILEDSLYSSLSNNTCNNSVNGIGISLYGSYNCSIFNNTCVGNSYFGIYLILASYTSVSNNTCSNNEIGINLYLSSHVILINNTLIENDFGINFESSSNSSLIKFNIFKENSQYAIALTSGSANIIHHNYFIDNNINGTSQALDDGENNYWFDNAINEGNYWSDWTGVGNYTIDGGASSVDPYPLISPPFLLHPYFFIRTLQEIIIKLTN